MNKSARLSVSVLVVSATLLLAALACNQETTSTPDEEPAQTNVPNAPADSQDPSEEAITPQSVTPLFNGEDLRGWHADVPATDDSDAGASHPESFIVRDGLLVSMGEPRGHLITDNRYRNYRLEIEYRFPAEGGNCGVLVHASTPRALYEMFPQSIEVQMRAGDAGDFWCIEEDIQVPDMEVRRPRKEGEVWGGSAGDARRILNLTDDSEKPLGEWNTMIIEAVEDTIKVWVNGTLVNHGTDATISAGQIALQAEGTMVELRKVDIGPTAGSPHSDG